MGVVSSARARVPVALVGTAARLLLAGVFGYAGLVKIPDLAGAGRVVALYQLMPADAARLLGGVLPFVELALALLLLVGLATRLTAGCAAALLLGYLGAIVSAWGRGISIDCGCFGGGGVVASGAVGGYVLDIGRDLVFLAVAGFLVRRPRTTYALDSWIMVTKGR